MDASQLSVLQLDKLQRIGHSPDFARPGSAQTAEAAVMFTLDEFGVEMPPDGRNTEPRRLQTTVSGAGTAAAQSTSQELPRLASLLVGAHGAGAGVMYGVTSSGGRLGIHCGHFRATGKGAHPSGRSLMLRLLRSHVAPVRAHIADDSTWSGFQRAGLALGIPLPQSEVGLSGRPLDRLIRAMTGGTWGYLVIAEPLLDAQSAGLRDRVMQEIRRVEATKSASGVSNPLAQRYLELLQATLHDLSLGMALGLWRSATYLLATDSNYAELAALWRGLQSEGGISREPMRVLEHPAVVEWAQRQALPDLPSDEICNPFAFQSLLTSHQLAHLVDLPSREAPGIVLRKYAKFDTSPSTLATPGTQSLYIGNVEFAGLQSEPYHVGLQALTRHVLIAGVTGSGKSNTVVHLLRQLHGLRIPFLVLEPAKSEYRALCRDATLKDDLTIYTVGDERTSPIRVNPFEVVGWPANAVSVHIDLLRSCFAASFGLWSPLPQILEQCLHEVYRDEGWDPVTNTNRRLHPGDDPAQAFPTLADLAAKVDTYISSLGYDDRVRADLRAALLTRVNALRVGGKGAMFDTRASMPMDVLLDKPCVMELQNLGDDDDKAFLMALLFIRLVEHRRTTAGRGGLAHVLVIEEAHRLLTNTAGKSGSPEQADPRGKAVETFSNLISEIRAYGQGIAIVDQVPTKLAPDAIKNTNLKIAHRIVATDDREAMAGAMSMDPQQKGALATFGVGTVAVFQDGEDAPLLVGVPQVKDNLGAAPTDEEVGTAMRGSQGRTYELLRGGPYRWCATSCAVGARQCRLATLAAAFDPLLLHAFSKLVVSSLGAHASLPHGLALFANTARMRLGAELNEQELACLYSDLSARLSRRWGALVSASHVRTQDFAEALARLCIDSKAAAACVDRLSDFASAGRALLAGDSLSYCAACQLSRDKFGDAQPCFGRAAVLAAVQGGSLVPMLSEALTRDLQANDDARTYTLQVVNNAAYELVEFPGEASEDPLAEGMLARRCLMCTTFHAMVAARPWGHERVRLELTKIAARFEPTIG